ncbi:MAG: hypothetical protein HKM93_12090 [Desulfobacteraceae bacterium]|nr:hypothetical protein [Desulfobacteraceae bacterium]
MRRHKLGLISWICLLGMMWAVSFDVRANGPCDCGPLSKPPAGEPAATVDSLAGLQQEINTAKGKKTIYLKSGTYAVSADNFINVRKSGITIRSLSGNQKDVVIQGSGMRAGGDVEHGFYIDADDTTIADLTIREIRNHGIFVNPGADRSRIRNVRIMDIGEQLFKASGGPELAPKMDGIIECSEFGYTATLDDKDDGWYTNGIDLLNSHNWIIRNNLITNIKHQPELTDQLAGPAILVWQGSSNTLVEGNRIIDCDVGISFGNSSRPGVQHTGGIIRNNVIKGYESSDFGIGIIRSVDAKVINNTIYSPGAWPYSIEARFSESTNCLIMNNLADEPIIGDRDGAVSILESNIVVAKAKHFKDAGRGDLRLSSEKTPAAGAGKPHLERQHDIECRKITAARPDAGAYGQSR